MFDLKGNAQGFKLALEFSPVICPDLGRIAKDLKNLLLDRICNRLATFVFYQRQHTKLAKTTNRTQNVYLTITVAQVDYKIEGPFAAWPCGQGQQLTLPRAMGLSTGKLAFKTRVGILSTILFHGGPIALLLENFVHFLTAYVVVLHVYLFHYKQLVAVWRKMNPRVVLPRHQLSLGKGISFSKPPEMGCKFGGRFAAQQKLLEKDVFRRAQDASGFDVGTTGLAIPVCQRYGFQMSAFKVVCCITPVADDTCSTQSTKGCLAGSTGCGF